MNILADSNILFAREAFAHFGHVTVVEGRDITPEKLRDTDVLLVRSITPVNRELLEGNPLKFVASATTGTDHVDLAYLSGNNIGFAHAPGSNANSVAEYVFSALYHCAEKKSVELQKMTLGIVGVGNVGSRVARIAKTIGMHCLVNDPPKKALTGSDIYLPLETVLKESDIVTVHVPLVSEGPNATYHMINAGFISAMKKGAFFINTSRGDIIEEQSLKNGRQRLGCVVLDVWSNEPRPHVGTIAECDIATPHIAGYSLEGKICGTEMIYNAACAFFSKEKTWKAPSVPDNELPDVIPLKKTPDPVGAAIMKAYPIMEDDARFRKIVSINASDRRAYFDELRNNYPKRLEFRNYSVSLETSGENPACSILSDLGFKVKTGT
jgi:erythronate-4-phosphate dehydrogenase